MDIKTRMSRIVFTGVVWLLLAVPAGLDAASTNPQRGDHPTCENDCLRSHLQNMEQTFGAFNREGNYQEYEEDKRRRLGEEGAKPHRWRYKPISR